MSLSILIKKVKVNVYWMLIVIMEKSGCPKAKVSGTTIQYLD